VDLDSQFDLQGGRSGSVVVFNAIAVFTDVCYDWNGFHYVKIVDTNNIFSKYI
jgi:hypothetical protein